MTSWGS